MLRVLLSFAAALLVGFSAQAGSLKKVKLSSHNTIALRGPVSYSSVAQLQAKILDVSAKLPKRSVIFLVLDTPGGSVGAGMDLIQTAQAIPQRVVTITSFAASMGFITAQSLGPRLILPHGTLMSHRAAGGVSGQIPGEANSRLNYLMESIQDIERYVAKRLKRSHSSYANLIINEYWTFGQRSVNQNAADQVVLATCDGSLSGTETQTIQTFFGPVKVTFSKCPLVSAPLAIDFGDTLLLGLSLKEELQFKNYIRKMYTDKINFVKDEVVNLPVGQELRFLK